jgi:hypothetical protein
MTDLLTMAVLQTLEDKFLTRNRLLDRISAGIHQYLQTPKSTSAEEWVFIRLADGSTTHVGPMLVAGTLGWVLDMAEERERIDLYLGIAPLQRELALPADMLAHA